jgi:hypothetical protein
MRRTQRESRDRPVGKETARVNAGCARERTLSIGAGRDRNRLGRWTQAYGNSRRPPYGRAALFAEKKAGCGMLAALAVKFLCF